MTFATVIDQAAKAAHSQQNSISDGQRSCLYQDIPALLDRIDHYLRDNGVTPRDCLALECPNSLPGALTLLYLLQRGYRFSLLPPVTGSKEQEANFKPLPNFCQYRLVPTPAADHKATANPLPDDFLAIQANAHYRPESNGVGHLPEKLYLRTSGSMGASKIAVHSHAKLLDNARNCVERFQLAAADRVAMAVPIFHMYGLGAGFLPAVIAGASIDLQENSHLLKYLERERQFQPNAAFLTPALAEMLRQRRKPAKTYKVAVSAGARLKEEIVRAFDDSFGPLVNLYGSTELGAISAAGPTDPLEVRAATIGRPMPGVEMEVRAQPGMMQSGVVRMGELYCQHPYGFEAYLDNDGQPISRAETWFKTGDLANIAPDGTIQILGRADNSVNRDGYLVLLADIEQAVEKIAAVAQVVVLAAQAENKRGRQLVAFCLLNHGEIATGAELRTACFDLLPRYAVPDEVIVVQAFPTLPSGKVDRLALTARISVLI